METASSKAFFEALAPADGPVELASLPKVFHKDLENFMFGKTVIQRNGNIAFYAADFNQWLEKVQTKGLGYDVQLTD